MQHDEHASVHDGDYDLEHLVPNALAHICADSKHLYDNPHMMRTCCPHFGPLPDDATDDDKVLRAEQLRVCIDATSGMVAEQSSDPLSNKAQLLIQGFFAEKCLDPEFNRLHLEACCRTDMQTHQTLGFAGDDPKVACACALPRA